MRCRATPCPVCKGCHPQQYELWKGSHHALAMQPADATTVLGNFANATFTKDGVTSTFLRRDGRLMWLPLERRLGRDSHGFSADSTMTCAVP
jgi:cytochrome c554/c'-like protein